MSCRDNLNLPPPPPSPNAEKVENIFQWNVLKIMRQIKSYDGIVSTMFQAIGALTADRILKTRILILFSEFIMS